MAKIVKKEQAKFKARGYRFSKKTQNLLNKLTKRTKKSQNDVVRKALEGYDLQLQIEDLEVKSKLAFAEFHQQELEEQSLKIGQKVKLNDMENVESAEYGEMIERNEFNRSKN